MQGFAREALRQVALAEAVLPLWQHVCEPKAVQDIFERHRGACYTDTLTGRTHQTFSRFTAPIKISSRTSVSRAAALRLRAMLFLLGFRLSKLNASFLSKPKFSAA